MEVPVALQTAIANAAVDSVAKTIPGALYEKEDLPGCCGSAVGLLVEIGKTPVAVLAVVNAAEGGIGPIEDTEGNVPLGGKGRIMRSLGMEALPTFLVEGKVCAEPVSSVIDEPTFLVRAYPKDDNPVVARAYLSAAQRLGYPVLYREDLLARDVKALRALTQTLGDQVVKLGRSFSSSTSTQEKVKLAAELNRLCSQDLGGVSFMSENIHHIMGGVGMIPGTCACLSLFISNAELMRTVQPVLTEADAGRYADILEAAISELLPHLPEALAQVDEGKARALALEKAGKA